MLAELSPEKIKAAPAITPSKIMQIGMGFWASQAMLTAVKLDLYTMLAPGALSEKKIKEKLGFACSDRHVFDWLDTLVSLGFLERKGLLQDALYSNAADTDLFLDKNKKTYMGGILEMAGSRLYKYWDDLAGGLRTGLQQNEGKGDPLGNMEFFSELYKNAEKLQEFVNAMSGIQMGNFLALVNQFDFNKYESMLDLGGADGWLSIQVCLCHPNIHCTTFDMPQVEPLAKQKIKDFNLSDRIDVASGDLLKDTFSTADIITMGNILHGMNEEAKQQLVQKVYDALPDGGVFIAIENIIDNERRQNTFGLLMSLNMLIENGDAFDYTMNDFERWAKVAGFTRTALIPLAGPSSAAVAYK
jgi:precorrin-6B methylase 2